MRGALLLDLAVVRQLNPRSDEATSTIHIFALPRQFRNSR